ncbi:Astacin [Chionoecetes opilio]|uniref:Metalloendopeptidase n=1 Tax=Chionoecetes opilio TaxID=41210 RepID=A0A8J4XZN1_CHIOP|nr:Astacin [Chionoecetes opilio]
MDDFHAKTCLRFVPRTTESNYLDIISDDQGCWSYVGMLGGMQPVSLERYNCVYRGTAIHELMHAVGFFHEHTRNDRDDYVTIHYENVMPGYARAFDKDTNWQYVGEDYNYASIMHYGTYIYSTDWGHLNTIEPTDPNVWLLNPSDKYSMEESDARQINTLYAAELRLVLLTAAVAAVAASPTIPLAAKAMYNPNLFQGDIKGVAGQEPGRERAAILGPDYLWPRGEVPYVFGSSITTHQSSIIQAGMKDFHAKTCLRFVPRTTESDYLEIVSNDQGCWSYVGTIGGMQRLSLDINGCIYTGTAIHELMHAVGFFHEHCRNDRDEYVTIHYENVIAGYAYAFDKDTNWQYVGENYNYASIMHYGTYSFSTNWGTLKTIVPTDPNIVLVEAYDKYTMAASDANQINTLYAAECARRQ